MRPDMHKLLKKTRSYQPANFLAGLVLIVAGHLPTASAQVLPAQEHHESVGTVNCAGSTCHGSIEERTSSNVMQNEYTTWSRQDPHTQAYAVLRNAQSQRIARNLNLPEPATKSEQCLVCHAYNPPAKLRGARFDITDGVSCEGCHGPAGKWIKSHVAPNATHAQNIKDGLYPTDNPKALSKLCSSCHVGDANNPITHQIMGAGHPRISIELDTYLTLEPPHWKIDADWVKRKGAYDEGKIWAMGQFANSLNLLDLITDPKRNSQGVMPELMMFDCHACHQSLHKMDWQRGMGVRPGMPRVNDSSLLMVRAITTAIAPKMLDSFDSELTALHAASTSPNSNLRNLMDKAHILKRTVLAVQSKATRTQFSKADLETILKQIVNQASTNAYPDYADAEQAYMSISSVSNSLARTGSKMPGAINSRLSRMLKLLAKDDQYNRHSFQDEILGLKNVVGGL